jgi:5'-3' exonuclease
MIRLLKDQDLLFIDGSYFVFFRYYAILNWYRLQKYTTPTQELLDDPMFVEKYTKMFEKSLLDLVKKYRVSWHNMVFFKDSPREEIWRNAIFPEYKQGRQDKEDTFNKNIFKLTYGVILPQMMEKYGLQCFGYNKLEADDLIAITKTKVRDQGSFAEIVIVTNDNDYIQLYDDHTRIVNLQGKDLKDRVPVAPEFYLKFKIIGGDKSDCIPAIMTKLGPKTAEKLSTDQAQLDKYFEKHPGAKAQYDINAQLIDMCNIPGEFKAAVEELIDLN